MEPHKSLGAQGSIPCSPPLLLVGLLLRLSVHARATKYEKCEEGKACVLRWKSSEDARPVSYCTECEYMVVFQDDYILFFATLGAAALSRTHRPRRALHGIVAAFMLCLLFRFRARLLAFSFSLPSPFCYRNNGTASAATVLKTINLRKCTQLFVNKVF